tara:strand:- start:2974 stop:3162 length:189 start_codon:yes stop_codon:yes gene_type:complete
MREVYGVKLSKKAKARIARMSKTEQKQIALAAILLANNECITEARYKAITKACKKFIITTFP